MKPLLAALAAGIMLTMVQASAAGPANAFDHEFDAIDGGKLPLNAWRGKVLLIVNTASFCGFTPQYEGLQKLWERYEARGRVVIGVPSNDFGAQEPEAEAQILGFCKGAFGVTFPLASKQVVKGPQAHPFYLWAHETLGADHAPRWNFHKYLVGRDGKLIGSFGSSVAPLSSQLIEAIDAALATR